MRVSGETNNVVTDRETFDDLVRLSARRVPIVHLGAAPARNYSREPTRRLAAWPTALVPAARRSHFSDIETFLDLVAHGRRVEFATYKQEVPAHIMSGEELGRFGSPTMFGPSRLW